MKKKSLNSIFILILIFALTFVTSLSLNSNPFSEFLPRHDSSMFMYFGHAMNNGKMIYTEIFDHKGPMIFIINYLGMLLTTKNISGIYYLEFISLFFYFFFTFKTMKLWLKPFLSYISLVPQAIILMNLLEGGNLTEEFALPFISLSLYIISKYYKNNIIFSPVEVFSLGVATAIVFSLRANMIIFWVIFGVGIFIEKIFNKEYKELTNYILFFVLGLMAVFIPIGTY